MSDVLYIRKATLVVSNAAGDGLDLSDFKIRFRIEGADVQTPNTLFCRVYNLKQETAEMVRREFDRVTLQLGYRDGAYGVMFEGNVKQYRTGRENPVDTFLDVWAADGDQAYNFAVVNQTLASGSTVTDRRDAAVQVMDRYGVSLGYVPTMAGGVLPRGKVLYGMARDYLGQIADTTGTTWSIENGKVTFTNLTGYQPGEAVVLTSKTGMVGMPQQTDNGIKVSCLLNPRLKIGGLVRIDNASIQRQLIDLRYSAINLLATITDDGFYRVYALDHDGDTRGNEWYSHITCLAVDITVPPQQSVPAYP